MKNKLNKYIYGIIIVISIIVLIYVIKKKEKYEININKNTKVYYINLDKNKDRNNKILKLLNEFEFKNYERLPAINTQKIENINKYKNLIDNKAYNELLINNSEKKRKHHFDLTNGAIGCYLSHLNIYKKIVENNIDYALIFEDDLHIKNEKDYFWNNISKINIPKDADILLIDCINTEGKKSNDKIFRIDFFMMTHCYLITIDGAKKLLNFLVPIKYQIDSAISQLSYNKKINIYSINNSTLQINQSNSVSDIQNDCSNCKLDKDLIYLKNLKF